MPNRRPVGASAPRTSPGDTHDVWDSRCWPGTGR